MVKSHHTILSYCMMKKYLCIILIVLAGCARQEFNPETNLPGIKTYYRFVITSELQQDTKVHMEGGRAVKWDVGDCIGVYSDMQAPVEFRRGEDGAFYSDTPITGTQFYAFYPYECFEYDRDNPTVLRTDNINSKSENNPLGLLMVAKSTDHHLHFKQTCGLLHFSFQYKNPANLKAVFQGAKYEPIFGWGSVDISDNEPLFQLDADMTSWTLESNEETIEQSGVCDFYIQVPAGVFKDGVLLTIYTKDKATGEEKSFFKYTLKEVTVSRGMMKSFSVFDEAIIEESYEKEREALVAFYNAMGGDNWINNTNWCSEEKVESWYGVSVNQWGHVTDIYLGGNGLSGTLGNELSSLPFLSGIDISNNQITKVCIDEECSLEALNVSDSPISSIQIQSVTHFKNISASRCQYLKELVLPESTTIILINDSGVKNLDLSSLPNLEWLDCDNCEMQTINTANNPKLKSIKCSNGGVQSVDVSKSPHLFQLSLGENPGIEEIDLSMLEELENLSLFGCTNRIVHLPKSPSLKQFFIGRNVFSSEDFKTMPSMEIEFSQYPELVCAEINGWNIEAIDLSPCPNLRQLYASYNKLSSVDLSNNPLLEHLSLSFNSELSSLNLANSTNLTQLEAYGVSGISGVDLSSCQQLNWLSISGSKIIEIDLSSCRSLQQVYLTDNNLLERIIVSTSQTFNCSKDNHSVYVFKEGGQAPYVSVDYSKDGTVTKLQSATIGQGINVVLMGDAFSDRLISDGSYLSRMEKAMDALFTYEPMKSFRDHFNVFVVDVVSPNEVVSSFTTTALGYIFREDGYPIANSQQCIEYALKAISSDEMDDCFIISILNKEGDSGLASLFSPVDQTRDIGSGLGIVSMCIPNDEVLFSQVLTHEVGHAFAKLGDEYFYNMADMGMVDGPATEEDIENLQYYKTIGWHRNIDYVTDSSECKWAFYLDNPLYPEVDYYAGASRRTNLYRPTYNSIMRTHTLASGFNAPSREAIYYRIMKLAHGDAWVFNRDAFIEYDAINRQNQPNSMSKTKEFVSIRHNHYSPIIIKENWRKYYFPRISTNHCGQ